MARLLSDIDADIEAVRCAIRIIVSGKRVVVEDLGGRVQQYAQMRLSELRELLSDLLQERATAVLAASNRGASRIVRTTHSKGL